MIITLKNKLFVFPSFFSQVLDLSNLIYRGSISILNNERIPNGMAERRKLIRKIIIIGAAVAIPVAATCVAGELIKPRTGTTPPTERPQPPGSATPFPPRKP